MNSELINDMAKIFADRTLYHINLVASYGKKIGKNFAYHDMDKITNTKLLIPYVFLTYKKKHPEIEISDNMQNQIDSATLIHILTNEHHPEYWLKDKENLDAFTRDNDMPIGMMDVTAMSNNAIEEMIADWCAMSEELGNTPQEWANKVIGVKYKFSDKQLKYINQLMSKLWDK